jgi:uncharacterized lipoprotein YajG
MRFDKFLIISAALASLAGCDSKQTTESTPTVQAPATQSSQGMSDVRKPPFLGRLYTLQTQLNDS